MHGRRVPMFLKIAPDLDAPQITLIAATLQRHGMDASLLRLDPRVEKFISWVANKDPDFNAPLGK